MNIDERNNTQFLFDKIMGGICESCIIPVLLFRFPKKRDQADFLEPEQNQFIDKSKQIGIFVSFYRANVNGHWPNVGIFLLHMHMDSTR